MVQKAVVVDLCDLCMPTEIPAAVVMTAQINKTEYKLDLCNTHASKTTVNEIAVIARKDGKPPTGGKKLKVACPACGKQVSVGSGMALHVKAAHGVVTNRVAV